MNVIVIAGMPGSGKEELLSVARAMDMPFLRMGDLVREAHSSAAGADARMSVGEYASAERERHGRHIWAERAIRRMHGDIFLVDGCRSMDEVAAYRGLGAEVTVVGIHAPPRARYERLVRRARSDAPADTGEFDARDRRELSWGLGDVLALSDIMIDNSASLEEFRRRAGEVLGRIR
jgi:dephospho-CoA kinase